MKPAVFLDRDGALNVEKEYLWRVGDLDLIDGAPRAIADLNRAGYWVFVVSNQSGVGRGYFAESDVVALHEEIARRLAEHGAHVDAFYFCPHRPAAGGPQPQPACGCRKPELGMFERALGDFAVAVGQSWMIGDKLADMEFAERAGLRPLLVETGYGRQAEGFGGRRFASITEAVEHILSRAHEQ